MKKIISLVCAVILVVSFAGIFIPTPIQAATINELTQQLNALLAQVANLQARLATATGGSISSPPAQSRLFSSSNPGLQFGSRGPDVRKLQETLYGLGYRVPITGIFDTITRAGVSAFQTNNNISPAVGYVGGVTTAALTAQTNTNNSFSTNSTSQNSNSAVPFSISISPETVAIDPGQTASYSVTITPQGGFTGQVIVTTNFSDSNLLAQDTAAHIFVNNNPIYSAVTVSNAPVTATIEVRTTAQLRADPHYVIKAVAYQSTNTDATVEATAILNVYGGCNDPRSGLPLCGTPFPVNCLPDAGGAPFDKEVMIGEKARLVSSGGGNHLVWSAPGGTPSSKDNTTQGGCTYRPVDDNGNPVLPLYPANYCPQDGVFEPTFAQEGTYLVTVSSPVDTITHYQNQQAGAIQGPHATCKVKVSKAPTPPPPGSLSCTATGANATFGLINYTVSGATADTQCSWSCTPGSAGCPTTANAVGGGAQSYGPVTSATQITLTCNRPNGTNYSAAQATCSTTIGGTGTNTGNTGNSTSSNSTSTGNTGTGNTGTGNTGTGNTGTGGAGFTCSAGACMVVSTGAQYSTLASCRTACSGGNGNTGDTGTGNTGNTGNTGSSSTTPFACTPATQTISPGSATFTATGAASYSWFSAGANPLSGSGSTFTTSYPNAGTYTATVFGSNPSGVAACTVNVVTPGSNAGTPTCSATPNPAIVGQQVLFHASDATGSYSWSATDGASTSGSGAIFSTSYTTAGTKTVTVTSGGVSGTCSVVVATQPIGGATTTNSDQITVLSPRAGSRLHVGQYYTQAWITKTNSTDGFVFELWRNGSFVKSLGNLPYSNACDLQFDETRCGIQQNIPVIEAGDGYQWKVIQGGNKSAFSPIFTIWNSGQGYPSSGLPDPLALTSGTFEVLTPKAGDTVYLFGKGRIIDISWSPVGMDISKIEIIPQNPQPNDANSVLLFDKNLVPTRLSTGYFELGGFRDGLINEIGNAVTPGRFTVKITATDGRVAQSGVFTVATISPNYPANVTASPIASTFTVPQTIAPGGTGWYDLRIPASTLSDAEARVFRANPNGFNILVEEKTGSLNRIVLGANGQHTGKIGGHTEIDPADLRHYQLQIGIAEDAVPGTTYHVKAAGYTNSTGLPKFLLTPDIQITVGQRPTSLAPTSANQNLANVLDSARLLLQQLLGKL